MKTIDFSYLAHLDSFNLSSLFYVLSPPRINIQSDMYKLLTFLALKSESRSCVSGLPDHRKWNPLSANG